MPNQQQKIPENWEEKNTGDIFEFIKSYSFSRANLKSNTKNKKGIGNIHYGDIHATYKSTSLNLNHTSVPQILDPEFHPKDSDLVINGDIVMADASEDYEGTGAYITIHGINDKKIIGGLHTFVLRDRKGKTAEYYRQYIFRHPQTKKNIKKIATGVSVLGISKTSLSRISIYLPPLPEQKRIVQVLETWDKCLSLLDQKIKIKNNIKKALMQNLLTGKRRIKGFLDDWKTVKIGDFGEIVTGNTPPMNDITNYGDEFFWATAEDFNGKYITDTVVKLSKKGKNYARLIPGGSILVTCIASIGKNGIAAREMATNQQINSIVVNKENSSEFVYYLISNSTNLLKRYAGAGGIPILNKISFSKIKVKVPSTLEEQLAITEVLTKADKEIEALEKQRGIITEQKKFLLNNLITGQIRLPEFVKN